MQIKNHYAKQSKNMVCLLLMSALVFVGGCAQVANQKSSSSKYGQANASKWKAFMTSPTITPSEASQKINITVMGQSFRYLDGYMSSPAQQPTADQLYRKLNANKHTQNTSTQFSGATLNKVFKFSQQRGGILVFHCVGECANVVINVSGDFYASLAMKSQFPVVWFESPTLYRHTISVRIANPEEVAGQQFNLQVSLWDSV